MAKRRKGESKPATLPSPPLDSEVASRSRDPFETLYMGVIQTNDPLLLERGQGNTEIYRDLKRDGKVFSSMQKLGLALIARPYQVDPIEDTPQGEADAEVVADMLEQINFDQITLALLDGIVASPAIGEVVWTVRDNKIVPKAVKKRATRRFKYVQEDDQKAPELRMLTREAMLTGVELPPRKFIVHRVNPEDDNPYGIGLGLQLFWPVYFKRAGIVAWTKLNDRFGTPTPWGKYPRNATPREKSTLFDALRAFSNDGVVMTPDGTMIELLESKLSGSVTTQQALVEYMDDWIAEVLIGTEPRTKGGGALAAASKERADVREDLVKAHADLLSDTLNASLIRWICEFNGLTPCRVYRVFPKKEGSKEDSERDRNVADLGFELSEDAVKARYGDGWSKAKAAPPPVVPPGTGTALAQDGTKPAEPVVDDKIPADDKPAQFAEPAADIDNRLSRLRARRNPPVGEPSVVATNGQQAIDQAIAAIRESDLQDAMRDLMEPMLAAIEAADTFEDALAAAEAAYPSMDKSRLQHLLARAMFGGEAYGRQVEL